MKGQDRGGKVSRRGAHLSIQQQEQCPGLPLPDSFCISPALGLHGHGKKRCRISAASRAETSKRQPAGRSATNERSAVWQCSRPNRPSADTLRVRAPTPRSSQLEGSAAAATRRHTQHKPNLHTAKPCSPALCSTVPRAHQSSFLLALSWRTIVTPSALHEGAYAPAMKATAVTVLIIWCDLWQKHGAQELQSAERPWRPLPRSFGAGRADWGWRAPRSR